ncbi:hypothetical protein V9T40_006988 [Parthenolecanium corni]|uniref:RNA-directed DNA polymerase n=1 Tax=Parthenolecanium corni TaxID=536013 RepID=A0AAN9TU45_9HEMI
MNNTNTIQKFGFQPTPSIGFKNNTQFHNKPTFNNNQLEFRPTYFTFMGYLVLGDRIAVELIYKNLENSNVNKCSKISELLCNKDNDSETLLANIHSLPKNTQKVIIILGNDEHKKSNFHAEKFFDNLEKIIKKLKEFRVTSIILGKIIPKFTSLNDLQYWNLINNINAKIHETSAKFKLQFINLDQVVLEFDKNKNYNQGQFYFGKDKKIRFRFMASRMLENSQLTDMAYQVMASKIEWLIKEIEKPKPSVHFIDEGSTNHTNTTSEEGGNCEVKEGEKVTKNNDIPSDININTVEFQVEIPPEFRNVDPIVSSLVTDTGYRQVKSFSVSPPEREIVSIKIPDYLFAPYILFEINGHVLPALLDSGSPYTFMNEDLFLLVSKGANPSEIRRVAAAKINVRGVLGKRPATVVENAHTVLKFIDPSLQRIPAWSIIRVIRGFNTPIILGREFLDVYSVKMGFGLRRGLTFLKPSTNEKIRLKVYNCNEIKKMVLNETLEDPHKILRNCKVSTIQSNNIPETSVNMIELEEDDNLELLTYDNELWSVDTERELLASCPNLNDMNNHIKKRFENEQIGTSTLRPRRLIVPNTPDFSKKSDYKPQPLPGWRHILKRGENNKPIFHKIDKNLYHELEDEETVCDVSISTKSQDQTLPPQIQDLIEQYSSSVCSGIRGRSRLYTHHLEVKSEYHPTLCKYYDLPLKIRDEARETIQDWLRIDTIRLSNSPYRNPLLGTRRSDGRLRLCGDYRTLNQYLILRGDQTPKIDTLKAKFTGATIFSCIDFNDGFHQIPLDEASKKYTAFCFEGVPYEFNVLPFGTADSMQGFLAATRRALVGTDSFIAAYVDDILVHSQNEEEHKKHLRIMFEKLHKANMTLNLNKCKFFQTEVKFLGFIINKDGLKPNPAKAQAINDFPRPIKTRDVQSFMGIVNYYRCHIPHCVEIAHPLHKLKGDVKFEWGEKEENSFIKLKEEMSRQLLEAHPKFDRPFYNMSDASNYGIGGFVYQMNNKNNPVIVSMVSRLLKPAELNYTTYERELLGLIYTLKKCRYFLDGFELFCYINHQALTMIRNDKDNAAIRIIRWLIFLEEFNIKSINYVEGDQNQLADTLSRYFKDFICPNSEYVVPMSSIPAPEIPISDGLGNKKETTQCLNINNTPTINKRTLIPPSEINTHNFTKWFNKIPDFQKTDEEILNFTSNKNLDRVKTENNFIKIQNRDKNFRIFLPKCFREKIIKFYHYDNLHPGIVKLLNIVRRFFDWLGCQSDIIDFVNRCETCLLSKKINKKKSGKQFHVTANEPGELIAIDFFGPLPKARAGLEKILDVGLRFTSVYRPASNPSERIMQSLSEGIRMSVHDKNHGSWPSIIPEIEKKLNSTEHTTTGFPPFTLMYKSRLGPIGIQDAKPKPDKEFLNVLEKAKQNTIKKLSQRENEFYKNNPKLIELSIGDLVYVKTHPLSNKEKNFTKKFAKLFKGPFVVIKNNKNNSYVLEDLRTGDREDHHIDNIKF